MILVILILVAAYGLWLSRVAGPEPGIGERRNP